MGKQTKILFLEGRVDAKCNRLTAPVANTVSA